MIFFFFFLVNSYSIKFANFLPSSHPPTLSLTLSFLSFLSILNNAGLISSEIIEIELRGFNQFIGTSQRVENSNRQLGTDFTRECNHRKGVDVL